ALKHYCREGAFAGAVEKHNRRLGGRQLQIDLRRMSLIRPDLGPGLVEGEALLVTRRHDLVEILAANWDPGVPAAVEERIDWHPATGLQGETQAPGVMAEVH